LETLDIIGNKKFARERARKSAKFSRAASTF
jgi:hypothetical protein